MFSKSKISAEYLNLVKSVLKYSPKKRTNAFEALKHPFFNELKHKETYLKLKNKYKFLDLFDYSAHSSSSYNIK